MPWFAPLIMAGAGLLKGKLIDEPKEKADRKLAAETQRYSPWTDLAAGPIRQADPFGSAFQGGMAGLDMSQKAGMNPLGGLFGGAAAKGGGVGGTEGFDGGSINPWDGLNANPSGMPGVGLLDKPAASYLSQYRMKTPWGY